MQKRKNKKIYLVISFLLIFTGIFFLFSKYYMFSKIDKIEQKKIQNFFENIENKIDINKIEITSSKTQNKVEENNYIAILEIPKINLKKGLYPKNNKNNNVNKNVTILNESDMPTVERGNVILASHSGTSKQAFFKNVSKLEIEDEIYFYYGNKKYLYKIVDKYETKKNGKVNIKRDINKNTLTLITCKAFTDKQIVVISEFINFYDIIK